MLTKEESPSSKTTPRFLALADVEEEMSLREMTRSRGEEDGAGM